MFPSGVGILTMAQAHQFCAVVLFQGRRAGMGEATGSAKPFSTSRRAIMLTELFKALGFR